MFYRAVLGNNVGQRIAFADHGLCFRQFNRSQLAAVGLLFEQRGSLIYLAVGFERCQNWRRTLIYFAIDSEFKEIGILICREVGEAQTTIGFVHLYIYIGT